MRGIASTSAGSTGVEITGIDTEKEQQMFTLKERLIPGTGSYFGADTRLNSAFIGEKLAKELYISGISLQRSLLPPLKLMVFPRQ